MGSLATIQPVGALGTTTSNRGAVRTTITTSSHTHDDDSLLTVDQLVRSRARKFPNQVIVSYPSSGIEYIDYTMQQLDVFAYRVACQYQNRLPVRKSSAEKPAVVALLGPSNLEYMITMLALTKLGHTVLFLSTRISAEAVVSLLKTTAAQSLIVDFRHVHLAAEAKEAVPELQLMDMAVRSTFEFECGAAGDTQLDVSLSPDVEQLKNIYIIHSSGSTGLPKPIYQTHKGALPNYAFSLEMKAFITLPLYHNHGICNFYRAIYAGKPIHMYNADLPLTSKHLTSILQKHHFEVFYGVPYALKLLAETSLGISLLRGLKVVMYGGSACPDELGDLLIENGVNLVGHYGATEVGQLMMSVRPEGDKAWNYVRETPRLKPFLRWIPRGPNLFECCVLDGWPAKLQSNQPDNSYTTKDLFEPHPTIPGAWKYICRLDDTIVLVNGEKFNPVALEGRIRCLPAVAEAVVFGAGRPFLGLAIVPAESTRHISEAQILDEYIWPEIDAANRSIDGFARIAKNMVTIFSPDVHCPRTDKGSIIRQAFYKAFAAEIEAAYDRADAATGDAATMNKEELQAFLRESLRSLLASKDISARTGDADFFALGMDSLQAIQLRSEIIRNVNVNGCKLGQNVVFDHPSINKLSKYLHELQRDGADGDAAMPPVEEGMQAMLSKHSVVTPLPISNVDASTVVVTGVTGSLGAHTAALLVKDDSVSRVVCFVRAENRSAAHQRIKDSLRQRRLYHTLTLLERAKIEALPFSQVDGQLGLDSTMYRSIAWDLRAVIHCAWSVNFNMHLSSFEDCIQGVRNLANLCLVARPRPATFSFCSSVSTVARAPAGTRVPETLAPFSWAQSMGYAQSKSVAEQMCARIARDAGIPVRVLRIGQIVGDTQHGIWNATEAIPLMLQTALTVGALPDLTETPAWLPVDTTARAVVDVALSAPLLNTSAPIIANVVNPGTFSWTGELLPALRKAGLSFETVTPRDWVARLRKSDPNPNRNPPIKLIDFFAAKYDKDPDDFPAPMPDRFETSVACSLSPTLARAAAFNEGAVERFFNFFRQHAWKQNPPSFDQISRKPVAIVLAGPCGSGKSTLGRTLAQWLGSPMVEGDELHTRRAVDQMARNEPLVDKDREPWLDRLSQRVGDIVSHQGYDTVAVSCSALKRVYRARLRQRLGEKGVDVLFVDLQASADVLAERMRARDPSHYMGFDMIDGQLACREEIGVDETDVVPIGVEGDLESTLRELQWAVSDITMKSS